MKNVSAPASSVKLEVTDTTAVMMATDMEVGIRVNVEGRFRRLCIQAACFTPNL